MEGKRRKTKMKSRLRGRPPIYTAELGLVICREISGGKSLRTVCDMVGMPDRQTVFRWLSGHGEHQLFCDQYARACVERGHAIAEQALAIADSQVRRGKDGRLDAAEVNQLRLRVDTRRWFASKLAPKAFGDRLQAEVTGADGGPVFQLAPVDWDRLIARVTRQAGVEPRLPQETAAGAGEA